MEQARQKKIALSHEIEQTYLALSGTANFNLIGWQPRDKERAEIVTHIFRDVTDDKPAQVTEEYEEFALPYQRIILPLWDCTDETHIEGSDPEKVLAALPTVKQQAKALLNNQNLLKAIYKLEYLTNKTLNRKPPEHARFNALIVDTEKLIKQNYSDTTFEALGYRPGFWDGTVKKLATQRGARQLQVNFIEKLMEYLQSVQVDFEYNSKSARLVPEDRELFYAQLTQQLAAGLSVVRTEIASENNKFTSKLGKIIDHLDNQYKLSNSDRVEGMGLLADLMDSTRQTQATFEFHSAAIRANYDTETLQITAAAAAAA